MGLAKSAAQLDDGCSDDVRPRQQAARQATQPPNDARAINLVVGGGSVLPASPPGVESTVASKECVMDEPSDRMQDPAKRAERYEKVAEEYSDLLKDAASPFLPAYYQHRSRHLSAGPAVLRRSANLQGTSRRAPGLACSK
jgi:hypothetical protein